MKTVLTTEPLLQYPDFFVKVQDEVGQDISNANSNRRQRNRSEIKKENFGLLRIYFKLAERLMEADH